MRIGSGAVASSANFVPELARNYEQAAEASARPDFVRLEKLRDTLYLEAAAFTPANTAGTGWSRWLFTNRFIPVANSGKAGNSAAFMAVSSLALLAASAVQDEPAANNTTGTTAATPTNTVLADDASVTTVGTWTALATVTGVPDITRPSTINVGASKTYRFTSTSGNRARAILQGLANVSNGGFGRVQLFADPDGANTNVSDTYLLPVKTSGFHLLNMKDPDASPSRVLYPLFEGLPDGTYDLVIDEHPDNPATGRVQVGELRFFTDVAFDETGLHGIGYPRTVSSTSVLSVFNPGARIVKTFTDATGVILSWARSSTGGIVSLTMYDSVGDEVEISTNTLDTSGALASRSTLLMTGQTKGTYHLHIQVQDTTNGTRFLYYDNGATAFDETTAGTPGTDPFLLPDYSTNQANSSDVGNSGLLTGNLESAFQCYDPDLGVGTANFVTSIHGAEGPPYDVSVTVDGDVVDYAGASAGATWDGSRIIFEFTVDVYYPTDVDTGTGTGFAVGATPFMAQTYRFDLTKRGLFTTVTRTVSKSVRAICDFAVMGQAFNGNTTSPALGDGADNVARSDAANLLLDSYAGGALTRDDNQTECWVLGGTSFIALARSLNIVELQQKFAPFALAQTNLAEWRSNVDTTKVYTSSFPRLLNATPGILLEAGFTWRLKTHFDVALGNLLAEVGLP
jgi:hypothetical protein